MIYFITDGCGNVKIGYTSEYVITKRLKQLQTGNAHNLTCLYFFEGSMETESYIQEMFEEYRCENDNLESSEWFRIEGKLKELLDSSEDDFRVFVSNLPTKKDFYRMNFYCKKHPNEEGSLRYYKKIAEDQKKQISSMKRKITNLEHKLGIPFERRTKYERLI